MFPPDSVISGYVSRDFIDICFMFYLSLLPYVSLACTMSSLSLSRTPQFPLDPILLSSLRLLRSRTCIPLRCIRSLVYIFRVLVVRIRSTILTQPGTPVSFQGMLFTHYSISGNSGFSDVFHFQKTPELRRFRFPETPDSDVFRDFHIM